MLTDREKAIATAAMNWVHKNPFADPPIEEIFAEIEDVVGNIEQETRSSALNTLTNGK